MDDEQKGTSYINDMGKESVKENFRGKKVEEMKYRRTSAEVMELYGDWGIIGVICA